jgi:hypothetical protein
VNGYELRAACRHRRDVDDDLATADLTTAVAVASGTRTRCPVLGHGSHQGCEPPWLRALASRAQQAGTVSRSPHAQHRFERHPGAAAAPLPCGYRPRRPEATALYRVVADHVETMLEQARERSAHGFGLPRHVERTFHRYLACGILAHGFARVSCTSCRDEILVAFSCKTRGLCPSCDGRRMADTAAHLCDRVMPDAGYRQWTLSFPRWLRLRLLRDPALVSEILGAFVRVVFAYQRRRARALGVADGQLGAVTAVQRFGAFVNANLHFHTLIPDGVWQEQPDGTVRFHRLPPPADGDVGELAARVVRRTARILGRRGADLPGDDEPDALGCAQAESVQTPLALAEPEARPPRSQRRLCAFVDGFSLHANTSVDAADRAALERLARYLLRPAISADRLALRPDGRVEYRFRRPDPAGRTSWVTDGPTLCRRLATLIPPRRSHTVRYHGVFAPAHRLRDRIVPAPPDDDGPAPAAPTTSTRARRLDWAALLERVFAVDVLRCTRCGGRRRVLAFLADSPATAAILAHLGLPATVPPIAPARAPPADDPGQLELDSGDL